MAVVANLKMQIPAMQMVLKRQNESASWRQRRLVLIKIWLSMHQQA